MTRRWPWLLVLAAVIVLLAGLALMAPGRHEAKPTLTTLQPDSITGIRIQRSNREDLYMRRTGEGWRIVEPREVDASDFHVQQVLETAMTRSHRRYPRDTLEPEATGLDYPALRLELDGQALEFGGVDAVDGYRYVAAGDHVHLVDDAIMPLLQSAWWNFIDRRLLPAGRTLVEAESAAFRLVGDDEGWRDARQQLSSEQASRLAADIPRATALVVREGRRQPDLEPVLSLRFDDGGERRFVVDDSDGEPRLRDIDNGLLYVLDDDVRAYLLTGRLEADEEADEEAVSDAGTP